MTVVYWHVYIDSSIIYNYNTISIPIMNEIINKCLFYELSDYDLIRIEEI